MNKMIKPFLILLLVSMPRLLFANSAPVVSNVTANQRTDESKLVDIYYTLADADSDNCTVWVFISRFRRSKNSIFSVTKSCWSIHIIRLE